MYREFQWTGSSNNVQGMIQVSGTANQQGNYSDVTVNFYGRSGSQYPSYNYDRSNFYVTIDGSTTWRTSGMTIGGGWVLIHSQTKRVYHNDDGTKTIGVAAGGNLPGTSYNLKDYGTSVTLDSITRTFYIYYNMEGGTGGPSTQSKTYGKTVYISNTTPSKVGWVFEGWSIRPSGTMGHGSVTYRPNDAYTDNSDITLYAVWSLVQCSVTFDLNGGHLDGAPDQPKYTEIISYGQEIEDYMYTPRRENHEFLGYTLDPEGKKPVPNGYIVTFSQTIYAQWELIANCYIKSNGKQVPAMMYAKDTKYNTGIVMVKENGVYKRGIM